MNGSPLRATAPAAGRVRVSLVSAERLLAGLPDRSIDLAITDPPYVSVNRGSGGHLRDWFEHGLTWPEIGRVFVIARRKLKADGVLMAMTNNDGLDQAIGALKRAGFSGIRTITWDRQYPGLGGGLRHQTEFVLVGRLPGSRTLAGVDLVSVAAVGPGTAGRYPTAKPDGLGRELAAMAGIGPGSLVVDPFVGSGALLVGAAERGATVIGGDVAKRAVQQASARLARAGVARGRSSPSKPNGTSRSSRTTRPARPGRPNGSSRSSRTTSPARPGKPNGSSRSSPGRPNGTGRSSPVTRAASRGRPNGSSRSTTATRAARPARPNGPSRSSRTTRPASIGRPTGSSRSSRTTRPASIGRPTGSSQSTPATRPIKAGRPTGSSRSTLITRPSRPSRPSRPGRPTGSSQSTPATRPASRGLMRKLRPGSRR